MLQAKIERVSLDEALLQHQNKEGEQYHRGKPGSTPFGGSGAYTMQLQWKNEEMMLIDSKYFADAANAEENSKPSQPCYLWFNDQRDHD